MHTRGVIRGLSISTFVFLCLGCRSANESRLIGTYRADTSCMTVTLVVNKDHSFVQSAQARSGETNRLTGKWSLDKKDKMMTFKPFLDFLNDDHGRRLTFASFSPELMGLVTEMGPVIVKCPDSDRQINYVK
jgi:hypothetical protein